MERIGFGLLGWLAGAAVLTGGATLVVVARSRRKPATEAAESPRSEELSRA